MKKFPETFRLLRLTLILPLAAAVSAPRLQAAVELTPLWSVDPSLGLAWAGLENTERGIAWNPVSGHVLVCTGIGYEIHVLNSSSGAVVEDPELDSEGQPTGLTVPRKLLKGPYYNPAVDPVPVPVIETASITRHLNQVGVADDGVIYACNLVIAGNQTANFRIYRWEKDAANTAVENYAPWRAWPPQPAEGEGQMSGNPDVTDTKRYRWGDTFAVRGAGVNTQILVGSAEGGVAIFTTLNGVDFTPVFFDAAMTGAGRGVAFGAGNTIYTKANATAVMRRSSFTLSPPAMTVLNSFTLPTATTSPLAVDPTRTRMAMIDLTGTGADVDLLRYLDITEPGIAPIPLQTAELQFTNPNTNAVGSLAVGEGKVFVCSTNKGIQAFTVTDDNMATPPVASVSPASAAAWTRGQLTLTGTVAGTPPFTWQWYKGAEALPGKTQPQLVINPVAETDAGAYRLEVRNAAGTGESAVVNVTTPVSPDTGVLTKIWEIPAGSRPWATTTDTARGMAVNPVTGRIYVASRASGPAVEVLSAGDGAAVGTLDMTMVSGGLAGIAINMVGVAEDGAIYACNLGDDTNPLSIYRWLNDDPGTLPELIYQNPAPLTGRMGDTLDVRGSGDSTELVIGSRNGSSYCIFRVQGNTATAWPVTVAGAPAGVFGLGVRFGTGNEVWAKSSGHPLLRTAFDAEQGTGTVISTSGTGQMLSATAGLGMDAAAGLAAVSGSELSDSVRLYRVLPGGVELELLDMEFYPTDNANANGSGAAVLAGGKLYTLNTNNGLMAFTVAVAPPAAVPVLSSPVRSGADFQFTLTGAAGATYVIERSADLADWDEDGTVTLDGGGTSATVIRSASGGRWFFRARPQ